ncbi:MAG: protein BatD [Deltaproteobacteria bacterium]|nr:MAG: protein BatD [Deltaproteobacteria bacterium]
MSIHRRTFVTALGASLFAAGRARARELSVRVEADRSRLFVGDTLQYRVEITAEDVGRVPEPILPSALDQAFEVQGPFIGSSSHIVATGSRITRRETRTYTYELVPLRAGVFDLRAFVPGPGGTRIASNPLRVEVVGGAQAMAGAGSASAAPQADPTRDVHGFPKPTEPAGDVFVWAAVDRDEVYVGEQVNYTLDVYERNRFVNVQIRNLPSFKDFWTEELPEGQERRESVGGVPYRVHPGLRRALFPQRAGDLVIGSTEAVVGLRRIVRSPEVVVHVRPLPAKGQPKDFRPHNVGDFGIEATVDRRSVQQGEPLTLTVTVRGTGNVRFVDPDPWPALDGLRRYDPTVEVQTRVDLDGAGRMVIAGARRYKFLLIPERSGRLSIPAHSVTFFDPRTETYRTARTKPIEIEVTAGASGTETGEPGTIEQEGPDGEPMALMPIWTGDHLPRGRVREPWLTPKRWTAGMATVPLLVLAGHAVRLARERVLGPADARAAARARRMRRARLDRLATLVEADDRFYAELSALLHEVAVARIGPDAAGLPRDRLRRRLVDVGVPEDEVDRFDALMDACDAARFGGAAAGTVEERRKLAAEARELLLRGKLGRQVLR